MTINMKKDQENMILEIAGRLDTMTAPTLEQKLREELVDNVHLTLDMKALEYISSAGLRVLLFAQKKVQKNGSMKLIGVSENIMEIFEITGFSDILTIEA